VITVLRSHDHTLAYGLSSPLLTPANRHTLFLALLPSVLANREFLPLSNCCAPAALRVHDEALAYARMYFGSSYVVLIEE